MAGTQRTKEYLQTKFETGDKPTQEDFADLITSLQTTLITGTNISLVPQTNGSTQISSVSVPIVIEDFNLFNPEVSIPDFNNLPLGSSIDFVGPKPPLQSWNQSSITGSMGTLQKGGTVNNPIVNVIAFPSGSGSSNISPTSIAINIYKKQASSINTWYLFSSWGEITIPPPLFKEERLTRLYQGQFRVPDVTGLLDLNFPYDEGATLLIAGLYTSQGSPVLINDGVHFISKISITLGTVFDYKTIHTDNPNLSLSEINLSVVGKLNGPSLNLRVLEFFTNLSLQESPAYFITDVWQLTKI